ncbi:hypothetical protein MTO96_043331 [Rhipicephalus appendiculatus]
MNTVLSVGELSEGDVAAHVMGIVEYALSDDMVDSIRSEQANDPECASLLEVCMQGWPAKNHLPQVLKPFWAHRGNITVCKAVASQGLRAGDSTSTAETNASEGPRWTSENCTLPSER